MTLKVVDLFCGAGGFSLGFEVLDDFEVIYAVDNDPKPLETYQHNFPGTKVIEEDVKNIEEVPDADVVIQGPPCPNFSLANKKRDPKKGMELVYESLRLKDTANPDYWILENVKQAEKHLPRKHFPRKRVYNCADYGVPQKRKRVFAGEYPRPEQTHAENPSKKLTGGELKPWVTVWEAIWDLILTPTKEELDEEQIKKLKEYRKRIGLDFPDDVDEPGRTVNTTRGTEKNMIISVPDHNPELGASLEEWKEKEEKYGTQNPLDLDESSPTIKAQEVARNKKFPHHFLIVPDHECFDNIGCSGGYEHAEREVDKEKPAPTINPHNRTNQHLTLPSTTIDPSGYLRKKGHHNSLTDSRLRRLTVRECARLQSFPDWFEFRGSKTSKYRQVGNAVPPLMSHRFAEAIKEAEEYE